MLKKVKKVILFSVTAICLMMCGASMVSAKECTCEQCQNQNALITAGPTATPDILKEAEERAYKRFKKEQKKENKKKQKKIDWRTFDTCLAVFIGFLFLMIVMACILI